MANVGTIEAEIRAGTSKLKTDAAKAKGIFTGISKSVKGSVTQINAEFQTMSRAAIKSFAAIGAGSIVMTKNFSDFEQQMSRVNTIINVSRKSLDRFSTGVLEVSNKYGKAARNEAEALYDVTSAGVAAAKAIGVLDLSTKASIAGFTRVDLSVKAGISTMNAYGLEVKDLNKIYDLQFSTVKKGILTYEQLGNSLGMLLPSSSKLGVSLEETFGGLAFLTQQGQSAEAASTALARSFDGLVDKSANLKNIGVDVFNAKGQFAGLETIITQLSRKMQGLTDEEKNATLEMIGFDIRATRAIIPMINNFGKFKEVVGDVGNSAGAMEKAFSAATDNINFEFKKLMTNISNVAKSQFLKIAGSIKGPIKNITEELQKINFDKVFNSQAMTKIKNVATGILGLGVSIVGIGAAIAILTNPITWLVGGAGIVYTAWKENIGGLKDVFANLYNWINKSYIGILKIVNKAKDFKLSLKTGTLENTKELSKSLGKKGVEGGSISVHRLKGIIDFSGLEKSIKEDLKKMVDLYAGGSKKLKGSGLLEVTEAIESYSNQAIEGIESKKENLVNIMGKIENKDIKSDIKKGTKAAVDGLKTGIKFATDSATEMFEDFGNGILKASKKINFANIYDIPMKKIRKEAQKSTEGGGFGGITTAGEMLGTPKQVERSGEKQADVSDDMDRIDRSFLKFSKDMPLVQSAADVFGKIGLQTKSTFLVMASSVGIGLAQMQAYSASFATGTGFFGKLIPVLGIVSAGIGIFQSLTSSSKETEQATMEMAEETAKANRSMKDFNNELFNVSENVNLSIERARTLSAFNQKNTVGGSISVIVETAQGRVLSRSSHEVNSVTGTRVIV